MDTQTIITNVSNKLNTYSEEVQTNLKKIIAHFDDENNLTDIEKTATQISFWRSIDDKGCAASIENFKDDMHNELESEFGSFTIFDHWDKCISWDEIEAYTGEDETLMNELDAALEVCYLQWFVRNWYAVDGHLAKRLEYFIIENNSVRNFDLQRFNFTDFFPDHKGIDKGKPYYNYKLTDHEIKQRVLIDMIDHTYHKPIVRRLENNGKLIELWYSKCELKITDVSEGKTPETLVSKKIKPNENENQIKGEYLSTLV